MKKIIFLILSVCITFVFALSGCSCAADAYLEFENALTNNVKTEKLVFDVEYEDSYKGISFAQSVNKSLLPQYENGKLVLEYNASGTALPKKPGEDVQVPQHVKFDSITTFNYIKSVFSIDVVFNKNTEDEKIYNDKIISEVYFYDAEWAYAPVYSKTTVKNTYIEINSNKLNTDQTIYEYTTLYKNEKFTLTKKYYKPDENEKINDVEIENPEQYYYDKLKSLAGDGKSYEYELRKVIDNVQLIFAARNLNIKKGNSTTIPTITYMYNEPKDLIIKNHSESSLTRTLDYNGSGEVELDIPIKNLLIGITGTDHVGSTKYLTLQKDKVGDIENYALPIEYAESIFIFENGSFSTIGALVYKLNKVDITTK